ncbi:MAG: FHA domain-containing protein [Comamonadaceae bacterium]|nr:FHA domain-containing protein [Comamonadaceae bacterium]
MTTITPLPAPVLAILEVRERGRHLAQALPLTRWPCTIGRAAHADAVLTDPALAAEHLRLERDAEGRVRVQVLDGVNGIWHGRHLVRAGGHLIWRPGQTLTVGRTHLALRLADAELPPPQPWRPASRAGAALTAVAVLSLLGLGAAESALDARTAGQWLRELPIMLMVLTGALTAWALLWMLLSKLFTGYAVFGAHLRIAALGVLAYQGLQALLHGAAFALSWPVLARFDTTLLLAVLAAVLWRHLCAATPLSRRLLGVGMGMLLAAAVAVQLGLQWQAHKRLGQGLYLSHLYPPGWRLAAPETVDAFMASAQDLQATLAKRLAEQQDEEGDAGLDE